MISNTAKRSKHLLPKDILKELNACSWKYNNEMGLGDKIHYGFIAQDLLKSFGSEYAFVDETQEFLKVNYHEFIGIFASILKSQQDDINTLKDQIQNLQDVINERH